jgi:hypothetical protein
LCENDEFGVRRDLGRTKHYTFQSLKKNQTINIFVLAISIQMGANIYEYVRVRQCRQMLADVVFGLPEIAWNVRSRFWLYWNVLE